MRFLSTLAIAIIITLVPTWELSSQVEAQEEPVPFLSIEIDGATRMIVTNPIGERTGSQGYEVYKEADNAELVLEYGEQSISYAEPALGEYELDLASKSSEAYTLTLAWYDGQEYHHTSYWFYSPADTAQQLELALEDTADGWTVSSPSLQRIDAQIQQHAGSTRVSWAVRDEAQEYRVYAKRAGELEYQRIDTTSATSSDTAIPWGANKAGEPSYLRVGAVLGDGQPTALSPILSTADSDGDGMSDARERERGTDPDSKDSDGDGLDDFVEINRWYSNPLEEDSDGDGYDDGAEVAADTLPNQASSYPGVRQECAPPESGDWEVRADCTVVADSEIPADLIVFPQSVLSIARGVTLWFDYINHSILVLFGGGIHLAPDARIQLKRAQDVLDEGEETPNTEG